MFLFKTFENLTNNVKNCQEQADLKAINIKRLRIFTSIGLSGGERVNTTS